MSFTNATPIVLASRAKKPTLGTNPLSLAAPALNGDCFVLDMATTVKALGKLEMADCRKEAIPEGWAVDREGHPLTQYQDFHALLPLGGTETSGN